MFEPNGPLPQSVYWRRRVFAAVGSVLAVVLLAWLIGGLVEADDQHPVQGTANAADMGDDAAPATVRVTSTARLSAPPSSPGPDDPRGSVTASPRSSTTTAPPATTTTTTTPPPGPPKPCPDTVMRVAAAPDVPSYPVGARPLLKLRIVNVGAVPCTRELDRKLREIMVFGADGTRLWSSNDCYRPEEPDVRVLAPKQVMEFSVNWAGRTSKPGCPVDRETVRAGTYRVVGKLGPLTSAPAPLTLT